MRSGIVFTTIVCVVYTTAVWLLLFLFPRFFIGLFTGEEALREAAVPSMHIYFFGFFMMSLQMAGQSAAVALGRSKQAVFFSLFRKVIIVTPPDAAPPPPVRPGGKRRVPGRAHLQLHRRRGLLHHHAADHLAGDEPQGKGEAFGGSPPINLQNGKGHPTKGDVLFGVTAPFPRRL